MIALEIAGVIALAVAAGTTMGFFAEAHHAAEETRRRLPEQHRRHRMRAEMWMAVSAVLMMALGGIII